MRFPRITAALVASTIALLGSHPAMAARLFFSSTGSGNCSQTAPCHLSTAISNAGPGDELACADGGENIGPATISISMTIDCAGTTGTISNLGVTAGAVLVLRNLSTNVGSTGVYLDNGTLILENVHISQFSNSILAAPTGPSTLVVKNCVFDTSGVLLQPAAGGSLNATFDHVTITNSYGGGMRVDATNGAVTADIIDSVISNNPGNGINAIGTASYQAIVNISNSVIARNGAAGVQANGASAGVLVSGTLLDQNAAGATAIVGGGNIFTYGNNRIVGSMGSGFSAPAQPH